MNPIQNLSARRPSALPFFLLALAVIALDQGVKWAVHTYMRPGLSGEIPVFGHWFKLHYILNPGMAFGLELPEPFGKIVLTVFRLLATAGLSYYILYLVRHRAAWGYIACMALILGGAVGNVIDSIFYGVVYHNAPFGAPSPWFHGQVIDMLYADIYEGFLPQNWPLIGAEVRLALAHFQRRRLVHLPRRGADSAVPGPVFQAGNGASRSDRTRYAQRAASSSRL